jgi:ABC-type polysaccharide/polyol phosphate export permease
VFSLARYSDEIKIKSEKFGIFRNLVKYRYASRILGIFWLIADMLPETLGYFRVYFGIFWLITDMLPENLGYFG